jgi:hypothetical protein
MASALITNRQYTNFYTGDETSWLIGNVGDVVELTLDLEAQIKFTSTYQIQASVTGKNITRAVGSWYDDGFTVGQSIQVNFGISVNGAAPTFYPVSTTIITLTPTLMIVDDTITTTLTAFPFQNNINSVDYEYTGLTISCTDTNPFKGIELQYGLTTNSQVGSGDLSSLIDGTVLNFKNSAIDASIISPAINLLPLSFRSGGAILSATIQGNTPVFPSTTLKKYIIKIKFIITPFYLTVENLLSLSSPTPYKGTECITDILKINLLPEINNPNINVSVSGTDTTLLGNTGWFNENYNGGANAYSINSLTLLNPIGVPVAGILTDAKTDFIIVINQSGATSANDYKLGFAWIPTTPSYFSENLLGNHENLIYNGCSDTTPLTSLTTAQTFTGYTNGNGARMDIEFSSITLQASTVTIRGKFAPNTAFNTFINDVDSVDLSYLVWVSVGDTLGTNVSNRVSLIADFNDFILPEETTETFNVTNSFLSHCQDSVQVGSSILTGCVEDEVSARSVLLVDTALDETIQTMTFTIEGYNIVTGENFTLESTSFDCTGFVKDIDNIQQINIDTTRGFLMANGLEKNAIKVFRNPIDDNGTLKGYKAIYSFRLRWEDWIGRINVPNVFFNNAQLNNGLNNDWATKDDLANWKLTYNLGLTILRNGVEVLTKNTFDFIVKTYEESEVYDGAITTFDSTKTNSLFLGFDANGVRTNAILANDNTWIEVDFDLEDALGDVGDIADYYGVIRLEEYRSGGLFKIEMLSSFLTNTNNILIPLIGETKAKLTKISDTKIRLEGLVNKSKLNLTTSQYKISARLGCKDINLGHYSSHYTLKYD